MPMTFDLGYGVEPFRSLCDDAPGEQVYPLKRFRVEWGPIFHRGRLDGSARVLVIGQDPAAHEAVARRNLCGVAGHRVQGFLAKLGIDRSYCMINSFLYSLYGTQAPTPSPAQREDRHRWIDAVRSTWMAGATTWAVRGEDRDAAPKEGRITVTIPQASRPNRSEGQP